MSKFSIEFEQLKQLANQLEELAGIEGVDRAVESALLATDDYVTREVDKAVAGSRYDFERTGTTKSTIDREKKIDWDGSVASVKTGFTISKGGLPSIFLMYGTPKIKPDTNLKNAAKGEGIHKQKINKLQQEVFNKVIQRIMEK